jgi:hypothetical protein
MALYAGLLFEQWSMQVILGDRVAKRMAVGTYIVNITLQKAFIVETVVNMAFQTVFFVKRFMIKLGRTILFLFCVNRSGIRKEKNK